jgi:hypothetical protein
MYDEDYAAEPLPAAPSGAYRGPSAFQDLKHLLVVDAVGVAGAAVVTHSLTDLRDYWWAAFGLAGLFVLMTLAAGRTIIREAHWDEVGVEFRWLYGAPTFYPWEGLERVAPPGGFRRSEGTGLLLYTRHNEMIEIREAGEHFAAFAAALLARLPLGDKTKGRSPQRNAYGEPSDEH